jgi:hypothetical protein
LLDLTPDDTGWLLCLCLHRQGDIALLPVAWDQNAPSPPLSQPTAFYGDALDAEAVQLTLRDLQSDGWQVNGRLALQFTGVETDPNFWQVITTHLWQNRKS